MVERDAAAMRRLLEDGRRRAKQLNAKEENGYTPLMNAAALDPADDDENDPDAETNSA